MIGIRFWKRESNGVRHETQRVGPFSDVRANGKYLLVRNQQKDYFTHTIAELDDDGWRTKAPSFPEGDLHIYTHLDIEPWAKEPSPKLTFGDLKRGDKFIAFPVDGDNSGHGGYLGSAYLFVVTVELGPTMQTHPDRASSHGKAINISRGVESTCPRGMEVLKIE